MAQNILVIGGVALGPKAACRCKRLAPEANVIMIDENVFISYGGCGMPFYLSGEINTLDDLRSTTYRTVRDPEFFKELKDIDVRTQTRAMHINREEKFVRVQDVVSGTEQNIPYDKLVIATGASPRIPAIEGTKLENVFAVTRLEAVRDIRQACEKGLVTQAVIVGGGFIGLECAVALAEMWGVEVSVVEMEETLLPGALSQTLARMAEKDCRDNGVAIYTGESVVRLEGDDGKVCRVVTNERTLEAQVVILAAGFIPNSSLARDCGLKVASFGGIEVNEFMETSDPNIYAGGDCVALHHLITEKKTFLPLGSMANRQGRVIGTNLAGGRTRFSGVVGTWGVKLFNLTFCGAGLTLERAKAEHFDAMSVNIAQLDRAHFYPEKDMMHLELVVERATRRVLGIQGTSKAGDALKARIDAVAAVLQFTRPTVDDISNLEIAYTPPIASAMDIVNTVANVADNALAERFIPMTPQEFAKVWENREENAYFFIDARPAAVSKVTEAATPGWHAIPLEEVATQLDSVTKRIPKDTPVALICNTGLRAYDVALMLTRAGYKVYNTNGGLQAAGLQGFSPSSGD